MLTRTELLRHIAKVADVDTGYLDTFFDYFTLVQLKKNEMLTATGSGISPFALVKDGYLMTYTQPLDQSMYVLQFCMEGWWTGDLGSFHYGRACTQYIKALEESEVFCIDKVQFDKMLSELPALERYFRVLFQNSIIAHQERMVEYYAHTAIDRYQALIGRHPRIEQVASQKYIAAYVGITPEFLSTLKRRNMLRNRAGI
jgi:CRP-like cAMP-binding protein